MAPSETVLKGVSMALNNLWSVACPGPGRLDKLAEDMGRDNGLDQVNFTCR